MPYNLKHVGSKIKVVGPFKGKPGHIYGTHSSAAAARQQQKALYANTKEAGWDAEFIKLAEAAAASGTFWATEFLMRKQ